MCNSEGKFFFDGIEVCGIFLRDAFHFSRDMQAAVRAGNPAESSEAISRNGLSNAQTRISSDKAAPRRDAIVTFLERLADDAGDKMPDRDERHLPFFRKRDVFAQFVEEYKILYNDTPPTQQYFVASWKLC